MPPYTDSNSHSCDSPSSSSRHIQHSPPSRPLHHQAKKLASNNGATRDGLLQLAAVELEAMRRPSPQKKRGSSSSISSNSSDGSNDSEETERSFPPACLHLLHSLPGNSRCHDCHTSAASWASVSYGITLCLQCSGKHRSLGVNCSFVKSLTLDSWKRKEILCMLEGGNEQLNVFFDRHQMGGERPPSDNNHVGTNTVGVLDRYKTKAASFYRQHLMIHAKQIAEGGMYEGREASRRRCKQQSKSPKSSIDKAKCRKKSREQLAAQLPTVAEKEPVEPPCSAVGA